METQHFCNLMYLTGVPVRVGANPLFGNTWRLEKVEFRFIKKRLRFERSHLIDGSHLYRVRIAGNQFYVL